MAKRNYQFEKRKKDLEKKQKKEEKKQRRLDRANAPAPQEPDERADGAEVPPA